MLKSCVILNGQVINIGEWDYQYTEIEGEQEAQNPLPEGATLENKEIAQDSDGGWYVVGTTKPKTPEQIQIEQLKEELAAQNASNLEFMEMILSTLGV